MRTRLLAQLQDLRVRAGDPSLRDIERLIARQARQGKMARSTISAKLAGGSPLKLGQLLSIVEAFAEYARLQGLPLPPQDIDQNTWRDRLVTRNITHQQGKEIPTAVEENAEQNQTVWDVTPLRHAGMTDLVELISQSKGRRTADWMPHVATEMMRAQMSCKTFMETAASESPQEVVSTLAALAQAFPRQQDGPFGDWPSPDNEKTVLTLIRCAAKTHGLESAPIVAVGLRRAGEGSYVTDFLRAVGGWHLAPNIERSVNSLRKAALSNDAMNLLIETGANRLLGRTFEVIEYFNKTENKTERDYILKGAAGNLNRMLVMLKNIENDEHSREMHNALVSGIPSGREQEYSVALQDAGYVDLALRALDEEPPF